MLCGHWWRFQWNAIPVPRKKLTLKLMNNVPKLTHLIAVVTLPNKPSFTAVITGIQCADSRKTSIAFYISCFSCHHPQNERTERWKTRVMAKMTRFLYEVVPFRGLG